MSSLQNTVTWYNTHLAGYIANNAAALKRLISFLSRSLCIVCRPAMKVCFVRCDDILITSFGNPCPPDWDGTPYFFMWMLILRTRESKMSMGYVAVEGLPCIHNQITLQLYIYHSQLVHLNEDRIFWSWWSTSKAICKLGNVCMSLSCLLEGVFNCKYLRSNSLTKPLWGYDILYIIRTQLIRQLHSCYPL